MQQVSVKNLAGENGGEYLNSASGATSGDWMAMVVVTDAVIAAVVQPAISNATILNAVSLSAGFILYGNITTVTVTSGIVQMINTPKSSNRNGS